MLDELTSAQLSEWEAFDILHPIDSSWRNEFMLAKVLALVQNLASAIYAKEGTTPKYRSPFDEIPIWDPVELKKKVAEVEQKQTMEELKQGLLSFARVHNAKIDNATRKKNPPPNLKRHGR